MTVLPRRRPGELGPRRRSDVSVLVTLWLFGKPGMELDEGEEITADEIRALRTALSDRLGQAADILEKLTGAGWDAQMGLYDVMLSHPYVRTEAEARTRMDDLGIDPDEVSIMEFEDEEDFDEELEGEEGEFADEEGDFEGEEEGFEGEQEFEGKEPESER
jgi:hypothetical protein